LCTCDALLRPLPDAFTGAQLALISSFSGSPTEPGMPHLPPTPPCPPLPLLPPRTWAMRCTRVRWRSTGTRPCAGRWRRRRYPSWGPSSCRRWEACL
jgi:hypothetical protein